MAKHSGLSRRLVVTGLAGLGTSVVEGAPAAAQSAQDGRELTPREFGARGDGSADDTAAFERAIAAAANSGQRLRIPTGRYRITRTLDINRGLRVEGDGVERSWLLAATGPGRPTIHVHANETDSIFGLHLSGLRLRCEGDVTGTPGDGIKISTGGKGAAISQSVFRDLFIQNVGTGVALSGVLYRSCFDNITVSGRVSRYGFYCDQGFEDVTYNSFWNLEVTGVLSTGYAYWVHSNFSNFVNLTADGCCYFSSPGGAIRNLAIEQITAAHAPSEVAVQLNQMQIADNINLTGIEPRKCRTGVHVIGQGVNLTGLRFTAPQPDRPLTLEQGSEGVISGVYMERPVAQLADYISQTTLDRWVVQGARTITARTTPSAR